MKDYSTLLNILKQLITEKDIQEIINKHNYVDKARKLTVSALLDFFIIASTKEFKSFRHGADIATSHGLIASDYSTLSKKASDVSYEIFKDVFLLLCSRCNRSMRRKNVFPKELLLIDSTTITVGKNRLPWAPYHGERSGVKLHTALPLSTKIPKQIIESVGLKHDSPFLDELADSSSVIVADRAYFQIDRCDRFFKEKQLFVIRMKTNIEIYQRKSLQRLKDSDSNVINDYTCEIGTNQNRSTERHRVVEFIDYDGKLVRVVTNLYTVSAQIIAHIYKARWGVEVFFRWIKQHLNLPCLFGTTKNAVFNQLYAALIAYVVLCFTHSYVSNFISHYQISFISFSRKLLNDTLKPAFLCAICFLLRSLR